MGGCDRDISAGGLRPDASGTRPGVPQEHADPGGAPPQFVCFADRGHGMEISGDYANCSVGTCASTLLTTDDGGRTWSARPLAGVQATAFAMAGQGHALLMTDFGLLRTTDGGATWGWG